MYHSRSGTLCFLPDKISLYVSKIAPRKVFFSSQDAKLKMQRIKTAQSLAEVNTRYLLSHCISDVSLLFPPRVLCWSAEILVMAAPFVAALMGGSGPWHPADPWFLRASAEALGAAASYYYILPCKCFGWDVLSCKALCHFSTSASSAFVFSLNIFVVARCYCWCLCVFPKLKDTT